MTKQLLKTKVLSRLRPFFAVAGVYMVLLVVLKAVEFAWLDIDASNRWQLLVNALVYNLVVASWTVLAAGVLYYVVQLFARRVATVLAAVLFALLFLAEVGLTFYSMHNGYLLGCELVARPLGESWMAVRGAVGVVLPIVLPIVLVGGIMALSLWRAGRPTAAVWAVPVVAVLFALLSLLFKTSNLVDNKYSYFIINKTNYLCVDSYNYYRLSGRSGAMANGAAVEYDESLVTELLATHPEWSNPVDSIYPIERAFVPDTFLNRYFNDVAPGATSPSVVVILVESLGNEYMGTGAVPFVDSLAATGLFWPNCLSATTRSYGAIPAITGSVGGPKCFQFGTMPAHNSLISLLRDAGYSTRSYYSGDYTFDCIYEYLTAQRIDCLSSSYDEYCALPASARTNWWGYNDDTLFARVIDDLNMNVGAGSGPHFSIVTTLSMHDKLQLDNREQQAVYERRTAHLPACTPRVAASYPAAMFTDDCLRRFIHDYSRWPDFRNTIFIVTGDHASGHQGGDKLSYHHVPLIIWSPLVDRPVRFDHVVTHNDIAPAVYSLLTGRYGLTSQPTVHWLGDGLGPTPKTLLVVNYMHEITDIIYHHYYYQSASPFGAEALYTFGPDMQLVSCDDQQALAECRRQLQLMQYLYSYTYYGDRLTAHPLYKKQYTLIRRHKLAASVECVNPAEPPSTFGNVEYPLLPAMRLLGSEGYSAVRVTVEADVTVHDSLQVLQFPDICIKFDGEQSISEHDRIAKFLSGDPCRTTGTFHLSLSKEFARGNDPATVSVYVATPFSDEDWVAGAHLTIANTVVTVDYAR